MKIFSIIYRYLAVAALLAVTAACADDNILPAQEGECVPVSLKVNISLPDMPAMSRSEMIDGLDRRVESLWVGVYNVASGERTGSTVIRPATIVTEHQNQIIADFKAMSGNSYIVAVANYEGRQVIDSNDNKVDFAAALDAADTWEKFIGMSTMFDAEGDIHPDVPVNAVLMSGHYLSSHANGDYRAIEPVAIPKTGVIGTGAIHLRRLISQVKFNVTYNTANISSFEIESWSVYNVPNQSWVAETERETPNAGDIRTVGAGGSYQHTIPTNITSTVTAADGGKSWQFDWWQLENKRTGLGHVTTYADHEVEFKNDADKTNTGLYKSLVPTAASTDDPNNNATFVELRIRMAMTVDENGNRLADGQVRIVDGVYTVHLGYCEGNDPDKSRDFNCRRNTKYTYNVTVNNVNDIYVEAHSDRENSPGAEGIISDVTDRFVELDAHYGVYNIYLSETDLNRFEYMIRCFDGNGARIDIDSTNETSVPAPRSADRKYLDWVEIRSTTGADVLSEYKPQGYTADGKITYTLDTFKAGVKAGTIKAGYYTVFFNEYVYEDATDGNENGSTAWKEYVNKPDRQVWIRVEEAQSSDGESIHFKSKYAFSQKSIQTYYNTASAETTTALGMEHINESFGLNLRSQWKYGSSVDNGRFNTAAYAANARSGYWSASSFADNTYYWDNFVTDTELQTVNAINNQGVVQAAFDKNNPRPLPALKQINWSGSYDYDFKYDPDQSTDAVKIIEAANACMNRNRDLDGDGKIDINEIRWYIPTVNVYIRMILGRRSLATPIMDYSKHTNLGYTGETVKTEIGNATENGLATSLMMYGSNSFYIANNNEYKGNNILWAMEGTSTSRWGQYCLYPWNVRCVRNLGTNMSELSKEGKVKAAYQKREGTDNIIEMVYYDPSSVRQEKLTSIPPHDIANQDYNRCYKAFQYSTTFSVSQLNDSKLYSSDWAAWLSKSNPCDNLSGLSGTGWRIPNQKEIAIMNTLGVAIDNFLPSATFSHYDKTGTALEDISDLNINDFKIMCIRPDRDGTQYNYNELYGTMRVRCVRDVD